MIIPTTAVSSSINATITILEVTYQLKAVDEQTADLLSTTRHVDFMVQEARRLRRLKAGLLSHSESTMIDKVIGDTEDALRAVAKLVEPCRVDKSTKNRIGFGHRVMWVFRDNPSVRDKHQKLQVCYQSLTIAFNCLYTKDVVVISSAPEARNEEQPPPYDPHLKELLDWSNRRKGRKSLGESENTIDESLGLTVGRPSHIPVAGPSSPCLLPIPVEDDDRMSTNSRHTESFFELPARPTPEPSDPWDNDETLKAVSLSAWDRKASSSAAALNRTPSTTSSLISPLSSTIAPSDSSKLGAPDDLWLTWSGSLRRSDDRPLEPTEASEIGQHPLRAKPDSDIHPHTAYQSIHLDSFPKEEDTVIPESRSVSVGQSGAKRGGRSWLAYHATRSDMGHSMDGDG